MRRFFLVQLILVITSSAFAQQSNPADTIMLHEVVTYALLKKYQAGAKIESIPVDQMIIGQTGSIDQLLMRFTPVYLKSNAGGLSTIHLRGTSPNHTSVNFGGININSLTLGHSNMSEVPVFLFDEIDSGISGETADKMANILKGISRDMQVINITHLPQIAAKGDLHYLVYKEDTDMETITRLKLLSPDERVSELAKMLSGEYITEAARMNAAELLK